MAALRWTNEGYQQQDVDGYRKGRHHSHWRAGASLEYTERATAIDGTLKRDTGITRLEMMNAEHRAKA